MASSEPIESEALKFHPKQGNAFESKKKVTLACAGIQGGKSLVGASWGFSKSFGWGPDDCAIIGAPTYKILNQSTLPTWMHFASSYGEYKKIDQEFIFHYGFKVYFRTSTDPYSIEGIRNCRWAWLDEAGMCKYLFWVNIEGRCARTNAPIFCTTTPYGMNWPYQHLIKPFKEGQRDDVAYHEWLSIDNPTFPREEYERQKRLLDPRTFRRKYMGIHERMEGLVYELSEDTFAEPLVLPRGTRFFASVDFGFSEGHEFAVLIRAITQDGFRYEVDEFKQAGLDPNQQIDVCRAKMSTLRIERFYCDPSRPDMISAMGKAGIPAIPFQLGREAFKPLVPGINKHIELIRSGYYKIFKEHCPHLEDEYETYHWPEYQEDKFQAEVPVKLKDHLMDCARMLTVATMNIEIKNERKPLSISQRVPHRDFWDPTKKSKKAKSWDGY